MVPKFLTLVSIIVSTQPAHLLIQAYVDSGFELTLIQGFSLYYVQKVQVACSVLCCVCKMYKFISLLCVPICVDQCIRLSDCKSAEHNSQ